VRVTAAKINRSMEQKIAPELTKKSKIKTSLKPETRELRVNEISDRSERFV
jgi:hypothetical protein